MHIARLDDDARAQADKRLRQANESLAKLLNDIALRLDQQEELNRAMLDQIAELNLRVRFIMETVKFKRPSLIVGVDDQHVPLYYMYLSGERENLLANLERLDHEQSVHAEQERARRAREESAGTNGGSEDRRAPESRIII
jgi:hypothetical protein